MSDDSSSHFVDTNILVYAHDSSAGVKHEKAQDLVRELWESGQGCLSIQVLQEFYVTVTRKVAQPLTSEEAAQIIENLSVWQIHSPTTDDLQAAIRIQLAYGISFWDSMIIRSAVCLECDRLWSEDLSSGQVYESLIVVNPFIAEQP